jgi:hypothetical protein
MLEPERVETQSVRSNGSGGNGMPQTAPEETRAKYRWYHKVGSVAAAVFCFELGVFLLLFPWIPQWDRYYATLLPADVRSIWGNPYFRGAVSGLGLLNIYISFLEVFRLRRFSG